MCEYVSYHTFGTLATGTQQSPPNCNCGAFFYFPTFFFTTHDSRGTIHSMEHLTKTQIVLLTLLVSFVTSIATGIVTVTLLDQAPPGVTSTINRVVERTIERIVPDKSAPVVVAPIENTEDLIIKAIQGIRESTVDFYLVGLDGSEKFLYKGFILSREGVAMSAYVPAVDNPDEVIIARYKGIDFTIQITEVKEYASGRLSFMKLIPRDSTASSQATTTQKKPTQIVFTPVSVISSRTDIKLGQTVVAVGYAYPDEKVGTGIVSSIREKSPSNTAAGIKIGSVSITTDISFRMSEFGGPMLNLRGELIGIAQTHDESEFVFGFFTEDMIAK